MGTIPNSNSSKQTISFTQTQLNYLRLRSNPITNIHIPRVKIIPKNKYSQKLNYDQKVQQMLTNQQFIDTQNIPKGIKDQRLDQNFVVFFEQYICNAKDIENSLELGENLYFLQCMLQGYQQIFNMFGKCIVENDFCFVTFNGEIRCWINKNPSKNEFQDQCLSNLANSQIKTDKYHSLGSQTTIVKKIIASSYQISNKNIEYILFHQQIKHFLSQNILLNSSFTAVKRFINNYLYTHRIVIHNKISIGKIETILNTKKQRDEEEEENSQGFSFSQSNQSVMISINQFQSSNSNLKSSTKFNNKKMHHYSASDDFSHFIQKKSDKKVSFKQNIKEPTITSTLANSKITKTRLKQHEENNFFLKPSESQDHNNNLEKGKFCSDESNKKQKLSIKSHRKMPSLDDEKWTICLTPPNTENKALSAQSCHQYQQNNHNYQNMTNSQSDFSENGSFASKQQSIASKIPFHKHCKTIFQSFQSIHSLQQNKPSSGYKGRLAKMGRTVKILHFPTGKKISYKNLTDQTRPEQK